MRPAPTTAKLLALMAASSLTLASCSMEPAEEDEPVERAEDPPPDEPDEPIEELDLDEEPPVPEAVEVEPPEGLHALSAPLKQAGQVDTDALRVADHGHRLGQEFGDARITSYFATFAASMQMLEQMARAQRDGQPVTPEQMDFVNQIVTIQRGCVDADNIRPTTSTSPRTSSG